MLFSFYQLIKYKIHIGHSYKNTKLLSSWILYRLQNNIWIIDIFKTIFFFKNIMVFLRYLVSSGFPIWFINLEITKEFIFLAYSRLCGEFACTRHWVRGMLSNYFSITKSIKKYNLKKIVYKSSVFLKIVKNWHITRFTWPRAIFVANINSNYIVCNEAISAFLPIIAIVDSNIKSYLAKYPIVSNDDSIEGFFFILSLISKLILLLKYKKVVLWFSKYKKIIKEINFKKLISHLYYLKKKKFYDAFKPLNLFNNFNKNFKNIKLFYTNSYSIKNLFNKKKLIFFDFKLKKKNIYFLKFNKIAIYKYKFAFLNGLNINVGKNIKAALSTLSFMKKMKRKQGFYVLKNFYNRAKYFALYWTSFIYSMKNLRVFYNTFKIEKKKKNFNFLSLSHFKSLALKNHYYKNFKYLYFPFFFFIKKKRSFFKSILRNYVNFNNVVNNKLNFFCGYYIKIFIELYYNKWFIYLLNFSL